MICLCKDGLTVAVVASPLANILQTASEVEVLTVTTISANVT